MNFCDSWSNSKHLGKFREDFLHFVAATKAEHRCRQNWTQWMKMLSFFGSQKEYLSNESLIQLVSPPMRLSDLWEFHYTTLGYGHLDPYTNTFVNPKQYMYGRHDALSEQANRIQQDPTSFNAFRSLLWKCWTEELWYNFYGTRGFHKARFLHTARSKVLSHDRTNLCHLPDLPILPLATDSRWVPTIVIMGQLPAEGHQSPGQAANCTQQQSLHRTPQLTLKAPLQGPS